MGRSIGGLGRGRGEAEVESLELREELCRSVKGEVKELLELPTKSFRVV